MVRSVCLETSSRAVAVVVVVEEAVDVVVALVVLDVAAVLVVLALVALAAIVLVATPELLLATRTYSVVASLASHLVLWAGLAMPQVR